MSNETTQMDIHDRNALWHTADKEQIIHKTGIGELKMLHQATSQSHKGVNGKLLIIGGSDTYHGAPLFSAEIASRFVDLIYFASTDNNNEFVKEMKQGLKEWIIIDQANLRKRESALAPAVELENIDAILIGPGMEITDQNTKLANYLLQSFSGPIVLDAGVIHMVDLTLLRSNCILTPHTGEFQSLLERTKFGLEIVQSISGIGNQNSEIVQTFVDIFPCTVLLKGVTDLITSPDDRKINETGNHGMTKGGTGDILAGLVAAFGTTNDLFLSACAAAFLNGLAADQLTETVGTHYNSSDLINQIPKTMHRAEVRQV